MKKVFSLLLAGMLALSLAACGGGTSSAAPQPESTGGEMPAQSTGGEEAAPGGEVQQVVLYNNKIEIVDALDAMAAAYNAGHEGVELIVETTGSDDYATALKTRFAGGEEPDIFVITGTEQMLLWMEYLEDLTAEDWVGDMVDIAKPDITYEGAIYGFPVGIEGYGYMYRKDVFASAGIDTIPTTLDEMKDVVDTLSAAGVSPFVNTFGEWYQSGMFYFSAALAQQADPYAFIEGLNDGSETIVGNPVFEGLADLIKVDFDACQSPMNTDFSTQVSMFGSGAAAMSMGGTWNQPTLDDVDPDMDVGFLPLPLTNDAAANDVLYAGVTNYWSVNKNSNSKQAAKDFLNWLVSDEEGQYYLTTAMVNIPAFASVPVDNDAIGALGQSMAEYLAAGKTLGIYNSRYPFSATQAFGEIISLYASGGIDKDTMLQQLQDAWDANKTA